MPFIGKSPQVGAFQLIDSITTSATDTYALTVSGSAYVPESARNLIVSLNGVTQAPESAYTVSGSNIVFASALTASDVIDYILVIGDAVDIGTPSDNTVGDAQLKAALDLSSKTLTFANDQISGDVINGGTISSFASTGIDDNATSTAITIDASENVGIGTTSPARKFHVNSGTANAVSVFESTDATAYIQLKDTAGSGAVGTTGSGNGLRFWLGDGATEAMRIDSSGDIRLTGTAPNAEDSISTVNFYNSSSSLNLASITGKRTAGGTNYGSLIFNTTSSGSIAERMRIDSSGNVGIGTASPTGFTGYTTLDINNATNGAIIDLSQGDAMKGRLVATSSTMAIETASSVPIIFQPVGSEAARIDTFGNVGIGSTTPPSQLAGTNGLVIEQTTPGFALAGGSRTFLQYVTGTTWRMYDKNVGVDRITLNSSGNVGLGTTSPAALLHLNSNSDTYFIVGTTNATADARIQFRNSAGTDAGGLWYATNGNSMQFRTNSAERMRIDSSGNVGIGVTPTAGYGRKLQVHSAAGGGASVHITDSSTGTTASDGLELITFAGAAYIWNREASFMSFGTSATERMRIDSSGNLLVGATSYGSVGTNGSQIGKNGTGIFRSAVDIPMYLNRVVSNSGYYAVLSVFREDVQSGYIGASQGGTPSFAAPSDIRLKENITDHESELSNIMSLRPVRWDWKDSERGAGEGFVAQELEQTGWFDLVSEDENGYKIVSGLGAVETRLIKALQEAVTRIETLESEVAALKGA
jgi:hypothetical protein